MPRFIIVVVLLLNLFPICECQAHFPVDPPVVGMAVGRTGPGDHAYNDMLIMGGRLINKKYGVDFHVGVPEAEGEEAALRGLVEQGCSLVFAGSAYYREAVDKLALEFPGTHFVLFDGMAKRYLKNVSSVTFRSSEASFLAGVLAARISRTQSVCIVGGQKFPAIVDFIVGFEAGALYAKPQIGVTVRYFQEASEDFNPWDAPEVGERLAAELVETKNCDVIFGVAGSSNRGVFKVVEKKGIYAMGVDSDQDFLAPGYILTSVMKRCDTAVVRLTGFFIEQRLKNRNYSFGLAEYGVGLSPMTYTLPLVDKETLITLDKLRFAIAGGKVQVPSMEGDVILP